MWCPVRALLIVNPNATATTPAARDLLAHALESRMHLTVAHTQHRGHAGELAAWAAANGMDLIVVHGGDGTINEAINGYLPPPGADLPKHAPKIAVLPGGSANVFARSLGIDPDPVVATNQLIDLLPVDAHRRVGLGWADFSASAPPAYDLSAPTSRYFAFNAGLGLDARVCATIEKGRDRGHTATPVRYLRTTVLEFFRNKRREPLLSVQIPDEDRVEGVHYAFVSNSSPWTYLDTRPICTNPDTTFDTGLGLFAMRTTSVPRTLRVAGQLLRKGAKPKSPHLVRRDDIPRVSIRAQEPVACQIDGDYLGDPTAADFLAVPWALDVVAPLPEPRT